jgi:hypothetical protein
MLEIVRADARSRWEPQNADSADRPWAEFRERRDETVHDRHLFVAKYAPAMWGGPWTQAEVWDLIRPTCWISDNPGGARSCPDLNRIMPGDLVAVLRLEYRNEWEDPAGVLKSWSLQMIRARSQDGRRCWVSGTWFAAGYGAGIADRIVQRPRFGIFPSYDSITRRGRRAFSPSPRSSWCRPNPPVHHPQRHCCGVCRRQ